MKIWIDIITGQEWCDKEKARKAVQETMPNMETIGAALEEVYQSEVIQELQRLDSPLYHRLVERAKELRWQHEIVEEEYNEACFDEPDDPDE